MLAHLGEAAPLDRRDGVKVPPAELAAASVLLGHLTTLVIASRDMADGQGRGRHRGAGDGSRQVGPRHRTAGGLIIMTVELSPPARLIMRTAHRDLEARLWDAHQAFIEELLDAGM